MNNRLGRNSLWLLASRLGTQMLMVLFTVLLARRLGSTGFGEYALLAATIFIGNMLTTFGTDMLLMREIASHRDFSQLLAALMLQLGLSVLFVVLVAFGAPFFPNQNPSPILALRIYSLALFPLAFYTVFTSALRGMELMNSYALLSLASAFLQVALIAFLPAGGLINLAIGLVLIQIVVTILAGFLCTLQIPAFRQAWHFSARAFTGLAYASAPIAILTSLGILYQKLSIYMLTAFAGAALTGGFAVALRAVEASKIIHVSVFTALYPLMARSGPDEADSFRTTQIVLLAGATLIALALFLLAAPLVNLLLGSDFSASIPIVRILAWMMIPYTVNTYLTLAFIAAKKERSVMIALSASLLILFLLNLWWIPRFGLAGAAWAALTAESFQALLLLILMQRGFQLDFSKRGETHEFSKLS